MSNKIYKVTATQDVTQDAIWKATSDVTGDDTWKITWDVTGGVAWFVTRNAAGEGTHDAIYRELEHVK
jgi:hypothetical protein